MPLNCHSNRALLLGAITLAVASGACSRGELSAAERGEGAAAQRASSASSSAVGKTAVPVDSSALFSVTPAQTQSVAPASVEDILKSSPLRNPKADCATPVTGSENPLELGTQCPTDPPGKKP